MKERIAAVQNATAEEIETMLNASRRDTSNGAGPWVWFRMSNGDLIFGCYPLGDTYETITQKGKGLGI